MPDNLRRCISQNPHCVAELLRYLFSLQRPFLLYTDLQMAIDDFAADYGNDADLVVLQEFFSRLQEAVLAEPWIYLAWRPALGAGPICAYIGNSSIWRHSRRVIIWLSKKNRCSPQMIRSRYSP